MKSLLFTLFSIFIFSFSSQAWDCKDNANRKAFNVLKYDLSLRFDTLTFQIDGAVTIKAMLIENKMRPFQLDLSAPLTIKNISLKGKNLKFVPKDGSYLVSLPKMEKWTTFDLKVEYSGIVKAAENAPWDGGSVIKKDANGRVWWAMACQGIGASTWFPCKDFNGDEPEMGVSMHYTIPSGLVAVGNGKMGEPKTDENKWTTWNWEVSAPINLYNITFYIGDYVNLKDQYGGKKGILDLDYFVLRNNYLKAKEHFKMVPEMLSIFEDWMGPYPFYEDGFKLVEAPYLGMEHQSAVAYGNEFQLGYRGKDRSKTGVGLLFDFIIVHESGHEWYGNNISAITASDFWIHEGFTSYSEVMYIDSKFGSEKALQYLVGTRDLIKNEQPLINDINPCSNSNGDNYPKAANVIHMIRTMMKSDANFKAMLANMNTTFYHKTVASAEIEKFIQTNSGLNLEHFFNQYLRTAGLPTLSITKSNDGILYKWTDCVDNFDMPILLDIDGTKQWLNATTKDQKFPINNPNLIKVDSSFYCLLKIKDA